MSSTQDEVEAADRVMQGVAAFALQLEVNRTRILGRPELPLTAILEETINKLIDEQSEPLNPNQQQLARKLRDRLLDLARDPELRKLIEQSSKQT